MVLPVVGGLTAPTIPVHVMGVSQIIFRDFEIVAMDSVLTGWTVGLGNQLLAEEPNS
jgi:hypothetical protein